MDCIPFGLTEVNRFGMKITVHCPNHGILGSRYIVSDAEDLAIAHEVEHLTLELQKTINL